MVGDSDDDDDDDDDDDVDQEVDDDVDDDDDDDDVDEQVDDDVDDDDDDYSPFYSVLFPHVTVLPRKQTCSQTPSSAHAQSGRVSKHQQCLPQEV